MNDFGKDLIQSMQEAVDHLNGTGPAVVHAPVSPKDIRKRARLTQEQMAPLMGMSVSGYRKWEQGSRQISGPALTLLRVLDRNPKAVIDAVAAD
ncbi:MAG: helix-turn-helix domain-containing protein [Rhizobiaceae bacterium]|nr:helix-turn-helix domain-containing protein [Rhizobiaceae bacterium]